MKIETIGFTDSAEEEMKAFLAKFDLDYDPQTDYTIGIYHEGELVATGAKYKDLFKMIVVDPRFQGEGLVSKIISKLKTRSFDEGYTNNYLFTKMKYEEMFSQVGFKKVIYCMGHILMEEGFPSFDQYLRKIREQVKTENNTAIVLNCNPMTRGHLQLIEKACNENEHVVAFIVEEDQSEFKFEDRIAIVREATKHLPNITVLPSSKYIISSATFPTYFLRNADDRNKLWAYVDALIFVKIAHTIRATKRMVGTEPLSPSTSQYNTALRNVLSHRKIELEKIKRFDIDGQVISASFVRANLDKPELVKKFVPEATYNFLKKNNYFTK